MEWVYFISIVVMSCIISAIITCIISYKRGYKKGYKDVILSKSNLIKGYFSNMKPIDVLKFSTELVKFHKNLHPLVQAIYNEFIKCPNNFIISKYSIHCKTLNVDIWTSNTLNSRTLYKVDDVKKYNYNSIQDLNSSLSIFDKITLDIICKRLINLNTEFLNNCFDKKEAESYIQLLNE